MKIEGYKIKLKDIQFTPYDNNSKTVEDGYLYYTLQITHNNRTIEFKAYDCPVIQNLGRLKCIVDSSEPMRKEEKIEIKQEEFHTDWDLEHSLKLTKYINDNTLYGLSIFESFGCSVIIIMSPEELDRLIKYVDKKIDKVVLRGVSDNRKP